MIVRLWARAIKGTYRIDIPPDGKIRLRVPRAGAACEISPRFDQLLAQDFEVQPHRPPEWLRVCGPPP
jgi:hypothetical protein